MLLMHKVSVGICRGSSACTPCVGGPVPAPPVFMSISDSATHITILRIWNYKYMLIHEHETAMLEQPWLVTYSIYVFFLKSKKYVLSCDVHCCILFRAHAHHSHVIHSAYVGIQTYIRSLQPYRPYQVWCNTIPVYTNQIQQWFYFELYGYKPTAINSLWSPWPTSQSDVIIVYLDHKPLAA